MVIPFISRSGASLVIVLIGWEPSTFQKVLRGASFDYGAKHAFAQDDNPAILSWLHLVTILAVATGLVPAHKGLNYAYLDSIGN